MDWIALMAELKGYGLTQPQIAAHCECGQATISDLANGATKDPRDSLGQALRELLAFKRREARAATSGEPSKEAA